MRWGVKAFAFESGHVVDVYVAPHDFFFASVVDVDFAEFRDDLRLRERFPEFALLFEVAKIGLSIEALGHLFDLSGVVMRVRAFMMPVFFTASACEERHRVSSVDVTLRENAEVVGA